MAHERDYHPSFSTTNRDRGTIKTACIFFHAKHAKEQSTQSENFPNPCAAAGVFISASFFALVHGSRNRLSCFVSMLRTEAVVADKRIGVKHITFNPKQSEALPIRPLSVYS